MTRLLAGGEPFLISGDRIGCLSTPLEMPRNGRTLLARPLSRLARYVPKGDPDRHDPAAARGHVTYPVYPTRAVAELRDLIGDVRQILPKVSVPLLIIQVRGDETVPPDSMAVILEQAGSTNKETLWLEDSGHVITHDFQREEVFAATSGFIARTLGAPA